MKKIEFCIELRKKLKGLPQEEIDNAINYYMEYFEDANIGDDDVLKELDSPSVIASQILAQYALNNEGVKNKRVSKGISSIWFIILAIFAAPIALPFAIAGLLLIFTGMMLVLTFIAVFFVIMITVIITGGVILVAGFSIMANSISTAVMFIGAGLTIIGIAIFILVLVSPLIPKMFRGIIILISKCFKLKKRSANKGEI